MGESIMPNSGHHVGTQFGENMMPNSPIKWAPNLHTQLQLPCLPPSPPPDFVPSINTLGNLIITMPFPNMDLFLFHSQRPRANSSNKLYLLIFLTQISNNKQNSFLLRSTFGGKNMFDKYQITMQNSFRLYSTLGCKNMFVFITSFPFLLAPTQDTLNLQEIFSTIVASGPTRDLC